jgi:glyoxylase-like metal-dependent hydrolase (beta-lactamase superfamily II)
MFHKTLPAYRPCAIVLLALAAIPGSAQKQPETAVAMKADLVRTGLYVFYGGGGNSLLRLTANGLIVVDGKLPGNYGALMKQVHRIEEQPVRVLINTDYREEHTGTNAQFLAAGAQILAHENLKNNLATYNPLAGKIAPPTRTYDHDFMVHGGGIDVQVLHLGNARTNADTVVYFPDLKVVAVGDLFAPAPDPDYSAGGSLLGWGPVLDEILKLDFDVVAPGAGPMVARADLAAFRTKINALVSRATGLVKQGASKDQLIAQLKTDDPGWQSKFTEDQLDRFYGELSQAK